MKKLPGKTLITFIPVIGCIFFVFLYFIATINYPGGSIIDSKSEGFSWLHNYWCNLLNERSMNGQINAGRPYAITGMVILCLSIALFWFLIPEQLALDPFRKKLLRICGLLSMGIALFLFTPYHDIVVVISGLCGTMALIITYAGLYRNKEFGLFNFGLINLLLVLINNFIYYSGYFLYYLPVIQKISFLSFLTWICFATIELNKSNDVKLQGKSQ